MVKVIERKQASIKKDIWEEVRGMWKNKRPDPLRYLAKLRKEWERIYKK